MLHMVVAWAEALEIVDRNPVASVEPPRQDPREPVILSDTEYESLLEACDRDARPMLWLYVLLLGETGLRCDSEACGFAGAPSRYRGNGVWQLNRGERVQIEEVLEWMKLDHPCTSSRVNC